MDEDSRHEFRIQVKKIRYAVEFFRSLYPDSRRKTHFVREVEQLQEALGKLNDLVTARSLAHRGSREWFEEQSSEIQHLKASERTLRKLEAVGPYWRT
jgi:CHAD domain-containing protein